MRGGCRGGSGGDGARRCVGGGDGWVGGWMSAWVVGVCSREGGEAGGWVGSWEGVEGRRDGSGGGGEVEGVGGEGVFCKAWLVRVVLNGGVDRRGVGWMLRDVMPSSF